MGSELIRQSTEYKQWLTELKQRFRQSQLRAAVAVNRQLLEFYWELGRDIVNRQKQAAWGSGFLRELSVDLQAEFPEVKGFSLRNLQQIRRWYRFWNDTPAIAQQPAAQLMQLPWWHNVLIKDPYTFDFLALTQDFKMVAEYALSGIDKPIGVSKYQLTQSLPKNPQSSLPSIEEIEAELGREDSDE